MNGALAKSVALARRIAFDPATHLLVLWGLYAVTRRPWGAVTGLPASHFDGPSILVRAIFVPHVAGVLAAVVVLALACIRWRWRDLEQGRELRVMVGLIAVMWVWLTAFMPHNLLFDQAYYPERALIIVAAGLTLWRPGFAPLLLWCCLVFIAQQVPSIDRGLNWTEMRTFLDVQIAFAAWLLVRRVLRARTAVFVLFACAVVAAGYWVPMLNKLQFGDHFWSWALNDKLGNLFVAAYVDGFLAGTDEATILSIAAFINTVSPLLCIGTLIVEASGVLLFVHARLPRYVLLSFIAMHLGIFASSGIFFYKWMVVDVGLIYLFSKQGQAIFADAAYRWWMRAAAIALVVFSPITLEPYELGWWDTRLSQVVRVEAVLDDGSVREVSPISFKPYDLPFVQGKIRYAVDVPTVVGALGAVGRERMYRTLDALDAEGFKRHLKRQRSGLDRKQKERMDKFITRFFAHANQYADRGAPLSWLPAPPAHIWHKNVGEPWRGERVRSVRFRALDVVYEHNANRLVTINDTIAYQIAIPAAAPKRSKPAPKKPKKIGRLHARANADVVDRGSALTFRDACTPKDEDVVTLGIFGDVALHRPLSKQVYAHGYDSLLGPVKPLVQSADLTWVNIEGTLSCCRDAAGKELRDPGMVWDNKVYTSSDAAGLNFHKSFAPALKDWGVDVVSTVNNHALDRGVFGLKDTLETFAQAGLPTTGTRASTTDPWHTVTQAKGMSVAWLACSNWVNNRLEDAKPYWLSCKDEDAVIALVKELSTQHDAVVFLYHGGLEDMLLADPAMQRAAERAADAGATVVASYHPHAMQTWTKHTTSDGREVPFIWGRGNYLTFAHWLEAITATFVYVGIAKDPQSGKARAVGVSHVPAVIRLRKMDGAERRVLLPVDPKSPEDGAALALAMNRFGATRMRPPTTPVDVRPQCHGAPAVAPYQSTSGELCAADAECASPLACVEHGNNAFCTQRCASDDECPSSPGTDAKCVKDTAWGTSERVCLRTCSVPKLGGVGSDCPYGSGCVSRDGAMVCVPGEKHH